MFSCHVLITEKMYLGHPQDWDVILNFLLKNPCLYRNLMNQTFSFTFEPIPQQMVSPLFDLFCDLIYNPYPCHYSNLKNYLHYYNAISSITQHSKVYSCLNLFTLKSSYFTQCQELYDLL